MKFKISLIALLISGAALAKDPLAAFTRPLSTHDIENMLNLNDMAERLNLDLGPDILTRAEIRAIKSWQRDVAQLRPALHQKIARVARWILNGADHQLMSTLAPDRIVISKAQYGLQELLASLGRGVSFNNSDVSSAVARLEKDLVESAKLGKVGRLPRIMTTLTRAFELAQAYNMRGWDMSERVIEAIAVGHISAGTAKAFARIEIDDAGEVTSVECFPTLNKI